MNDFIATPVPPPLEGEETETWQLAALVELERGLAWRYLSTPLQDFLGDKSPSKSVLSLKGRGVKNY